MVESKISSVKNIRKATHAGSWYTSDPLKLQEELDKALNEAQGSKNTTGFLKGIITPHAGYRFSLCTAAHSYISINPDKYQRIILMGPSHHEFFLGCGLPQNTTEYETPLGNFELDTENISKFKTEGKGAFIEIDKDVEESEHSLEMQLPILKRIFGERKVKLIPIMISSIDENIIEQTGILLSKFINDDETLFVISSDFCHWGVRYKYLNYDKTKGEIWQSIEFFDKMGMNLIEAHNPNGFIQYLSECKNTICGRYPIIIYLSAIAKAQEKSKIKIETKFVKYTQSNKVMTMKDYSVSYATSISIKL